MKKVWVPPAVEIISRLAPAPPVVPEVTNEHVTFSHPVVTSVRLLGYIVLVPLVAALPVEHKASLLPVERVYFTSRSVYVPEDNLAEKLTTYVELIASGDASTFATPEAAAPVVDTVLTLAVPLAKRRCGRLEAGHRR